MEVKAGYKQTKVGVIPEDWAVHQLGAVAFLERGKFSARPRNQPRFFGGHIPFIQTGDVTNSNGSISTYTQTLNSEGLRVTKLFPHETLFFTIAANIGDVGITAFETAATDSLIAISPKTSIDKRWLYHSLKKRKKEFVALATQNAQLNINLEKLRPYPLAVPPLPEQRAIAGALSDVDALIGTLDQLIAKKRDLKQAAMQQLLTGQTRLPGFHGEWEVRRLGDVISHCFSGATPRRNRPDYYKGDIRWITSGELNYNVITDTAEKLTRGAVAQTNLTILPPGTFLMAITGLEAEKTRGSCGIVGAPSTTNQSCMAIFPTSELVTQYLFHYYVLRGKALALQYCQGTKQQSYTAKLVKKLPIALPPTTTEQTAIAEVLSDMDAELTALEQRRDKNRDLKQGMMQELLTGRTRLV